MGRAHVYGDNVDTDRLFPGRYLFATTDDEFRKFALEDLDPDFRTNVQPGDVLVGGANFGCGSSREQAVACLRAFDVPAVIARSFARIYFRNAINNGVAPIICPDAVDIIQDGDDMTVDLDAGTVTHGPSGRSFAFEPLPDFLQEIIDAGGLVAHLRNKHGGRAGEAAA